MYIYVCLLVCVRAGCEVNQSTRNPICFYRQLCHRIMCSRDGRRGMGMGLGLGEGEISVTKGFLLTIVFDYSI